VWIYYTAAGRARLKHMAECWAHPGWSRRGGTPERPESTVKSRTKVQPSRVGCPGQQGACTRSREGKHTMGGGRAQLLLGHTHTHTHTRTHTHTPVSCD